MNNASKPQKRRKKIFFRIISFQLKALGSLYRRSMIFVSNSARRWTALFGGIAFAVVYIFSGHPILVMTVVIFVAMGVLAAFSHIFMLLFADNSGGRRFSLLDRKFVMPRKNGKPRNIAVSIEGMDVAQFRQASVDEMHEVAIMNMRAFKYTIWSKKTEAFEERNTGHIKKNARSILLILNGDKIAGFTQIVPLDDEQWELYRDGKIRDIDLDENKILSPSKAPYGLLLLSMVYPTDQKKGKLAREIQRIEIGQCLTKAIIYHVHLHCGERLADDHNVRLMFPTMNRPILKKFKDYSSFKSKFSRNGAKLVCLQLVAPNEDDRRTLL